MYVKRDILSVCQRDDTISNMSNKHLIKIYMRAHAHCNFRLVYVYVRTQIIGLTVNTRINNDSYVDRTCGISCPRMSHAQ